MVPTDHPTRVRLIGLLHCLCNLPAADMKLRVAELEKVMRDTVPLTPAEWAQMPRSPSVLEAAAQEGDRCAPEGEMFDQALYFVMFVQWGVAGAGGEKEGVGEEGD